MGPLLMLVPTVLPSRCLQIAIVVFTAGSKLYR